MPNSAAAVVVPNAPLRVKYEHQKTHLRAILLRFDGGKWAPMYQVRISYPLAQAALAKVDGTPMPTELGYSDLDELDEVGGRIARRMKKRIKGVAKKLAKSKLLKGAFNAITSVVPGGSAIKMGVKGARAAVNLAKGKGIRSITSEIGATKPRRLKAGKAVARVKAAAAGKAPAPKLATVKKLQKLTSQIKGAAPKLAALAEALPNTAPEHRDLVASRAKAAIQKLAEAPPEEREELAEKLEKRVDAWKVISPSGDETFIPAEVVTGARA